MADETRRIILQLQVDQARSIKEIVSLKDSIAGLRKEQKELNLTTAEGKKANEAYNAQIKALTKEQRSLELAVEKAAAGFQFEAGSIAANRAELSKLTAEYKNLANPTAQQTKAIKDLSDRLKEQEGAIGNTSRNVGNYKEALQGVALQLGSFSPQIGQLIGGFKNLQGTLQTATAGFGTLGKALTISGIALLVTALGSLISYFKSTDDGATKLEGIMGGLGAVIKSIAGLFAGLGDAISSVADGTTTFQDILEGIGNFIEGQINNRIEAAVKIFKELQAVFVEFSNNGISGDYTKSLENISKAQLDLVTGVENTSGKIGNFIDDIVEAAKASYEYAIQLDRINDKQRDLNITNAQSDKIVQQLIISGKNRTLSDQERIENLEKANKIEEATVNNQLALDRERLALIEQRNLREQEFINAKLKRDLSETDSEEKKAKIRKDALQVNDKLSQEQADLEEKIIRAETSFILLREKNQNKIDVLNESIAAAREKAYQEYLKQLKEVNDEEINLATQRQARVVANIDYELAQLKAGDTKRLILLQLRLQEEENLNKIATDEKLAQLTSAGMQEGANLSAIELQKTQIIEQAKFDRLALERKYQSDLTTEAAAAEKQRLDNEKKSLDDSKKQREKDFQQATDFISSVLNVFSEGNKLALEQSLLKNEEARKKELASSSKDKATQDRINKKYDDIAEKNQKEAAKKDLDIKSIQAGATVALGIIQALGAGPPPLNFILAALTAAAGAIQIANLQTQKAKLAKGGLLQGPSHANGGITGTGRFGNIEVEGKEYVVNKRDTARNIGALNYINNGGVIPLHNITNYRTQRPPVRAGRMASGGQIFDGGLSARQSSSAVDNSIAQRNVIMEAVSNLPNPVVLVKDINGGQSRNVEVKERARVTR